MFWTWETRRDLEGGQSVSVPYRERERWPEYATPEQAAAIVRSFKQGIGITGLANKHRLNPLAIERALRVALVSRRRLKEA